MDILHRPGQVDPVSLMRLHASLHGFKAHADDGSIVDLEGLLSHEENVRKLESLTFGTLVCAAGASDMRDATLDDLLVGKDGIRIFLTGFDAGFEMASPNGALDFDIVEKIVQSLPSPASIKDLEAAPGSAATIGDMSR